MAEKTTLEKQVEQLIEQVNTLTLRVFILEQNSPHATPHPDARYQPTEPPASESVANELHTTGTSLLPQVASVCFLLVIALALRTMTDSGLLELQTGALLGIFYASGLVITSWGLYGKRSTLAPVFNFCGAILLFSVTLETYIHFEAFPKEVAYLLLGMAGITLAVISHIHHVATPILTGTLGMCLTGVALDFPNPHFPYLAVLLWLANILGFIASRIKHCSWLRWFLLGTTLTLLQTWSLRIEIAPLRGEQLAPLAPGWLLPMAAIISVTFLSISLIGIIRSGEQRISKFDFSLPTVTACYGLLVGMYTLKGSSAFATLTIVVSLIHFAIAYWLSRRQISNAPGTNSFTLAGLILMAFALPAMLGNLLLSLPILSGLALAIARLSVRWKSGGMRITSYLTQIYTAAVLMFILAQHGQGSGPYLAAFVAAFCAMLCLSHYRLCRQNPPPEKARAFVRLDPHDNSAVSLLLSGLLSGYVMAMLIAYQITQSYLGATDMHAYSSIQTVTINASAIVLMSLALAWKNKEFRNVAILIMLIGGLKAFLIDLLSISGLGLVISIFSFGVTVSLISIALTRWQKTAGDMEEFRHGEESHELATEN